MKSYIFYSMAFFFVLLSSDLRGSQYIGVHLGTDYAHLTNQSNSGQKVGFKTGLTYGYVFDFGLRAEAEWTYRYNPYKSTDVLSENKEVMAVESRKIHSWSYMANAIYDLKQVNFVSITPFLGIGLGYSQHTDEIKNKFQDSSSTSKSSDNGFVYQGIVGLKYPFSDQLSICAQYHYFVGRGHEKNHSIGMSLCNNF